METRLESELRKKLISECLKWKVELKRLEREWRVKKKRNLKMKQHNKLLNNELVVQRNQSLKNGDYKKVIKVKECRVVLRSDENCQETQLKTTDQRANNNQVTPVGRKFKCQHPGCDREYACRVTLGQHMNVHTKKYQCQDCQKCFPTPSKLYSHRRMHNRQLVECDLVGCGQRFNSKKDLKKHIKLNHSDERPYLCNQEDCCKSFRFKSSIKLHLRNHSAPRPFQCQMQGCGKRFKATTDLISHVKRHKRLVNDDEIATLRKLSLEVGEYKKVIAVDENRVFIGNLLEKSQGQVSSEIKVLKCQYPGCEKTFKNKHSLVRHKNIHTTKYKCQFCQNCFDSLTYLRDHLSIHTGELPFECDWAGCGKRFRTKKLLTIHVKHKHFDERPFKCPENDCGKSFKTTTLLQHHLKYHSNLRPIHCPREGCDKRFKTKTDLKQHVNNFHSNIRKFFCQFKNCRQSFKNQNSWKQHQKTHHKS